MSSEPERIEERGRADTRRIAVAAACGAGLALAVRALTALADPGPGEPLVLRWLRGVDEHPLRAGAALALAVWAILRSRAAAPSRRASRAARGSSEGTDR